MRTKQRRNAPDGAKNPEKVPNSVREVFPSLTRRDAGHLIDLLIDYLDTLDSDPDLEDGGDAEPWLGWAASGAIGGVSDCEEQCDDEGDQSDSGIADHDGLCEQIGSRLNGGWTTYGAAL